MNITPNFQMLKLPAIVQQRQNNQIATLKDNNQDSFTHSTPSFKGTEQDLLKKYPELAAIIGTAVGVAVAKVVEMLGLNEPAKDNNNYVYTSTPTNQNEDTYSYYANDSSISNIPEDDYFAKKDDKGIEQSFDKTENAETDLVKFVFPPKGHRLKDIEVQLRNYVEQLELPQEYAEKLTNICIKLFGNKSYNVNDKILTTSKITLILYSELSNAKNENNTIDYDATKEIIDKYYSYMEKSVPAKQNPRLVNPTEAKPGDKIPLTPNDANRLKNIEQKGQGAKEECITRNQRGEITSIEFDKGNSDYVYPHEQLDAMFQQFAITIYNDYKDKSKSNPRLKKPQWMYNCGLKKQVTADDIRKEIESTDTANRLINKPTNCFQHIVNENYKELADVINNNPIYGQLFTIHSALRFMDRFIIFNDGYPSIEEQSNSLLKKLTEMIDDAYNNGATILVNNKRDKHNFKKGANIILRPKADDNEAIRMFGNKGIIIGIIERQDELTDDGKVKYNPVGDNEKRAIIATTLYPKR